MGQGHHPAGRQRGHEGRPAAGEHVRRGPHPVPGRGPQQGAPQAAPGSQEVLAEEKALADEANRYAPWARVKVVLWGVLGFGVPARRPGPRLLLWVSTGASPSRSSRRSTCATSRSRRCRPRSSASSGAWAASRARTPPPRCSTSSTARSSTSSACRRSRTASSGTATEVSYRLTLHDERPRSCWTGRSSSLVLFRRHGRRHSSCSASSRTWSRRIARRWPRASRPWNGKVEKEGEERGFLDAKADRMAFAGAAYASSPPSPPAPRPCSAVLVVLPRRRGRHRAHLRGQRDQAPLGEAAELHAQYAALKRYMKDFGRMQEKPPDAVVLWEQFLVYAVVFGIADQVVKEMQVGSRRSCRTRPSDACTGSCSRCTGGGWSDSPFSR